MGPFNPFNKSALVAVSRGGILRLVYQQPDGRWLEVSAEVENFGTSADVLTHASLCADKGTTHFEGVTGVHAEKVRADNSLLLVIHTLSCQLRLYRIHIKWNAPSNPKQIPPPQLSPTPTLQVRRVKIEHHCAPIRSANDLEGSITGADPRNSSQAFLCHLEFLPSAPESRHREPTYPTVMAIFSCVQNSNNSSQQPQEPFSVVSRWELHTENQSLHSSFNKLASKRSSSSSMTEPTVRPLNSCFLRILLNLQQSRSRVL